MAGHGGIGGLCCAKGNRAPPSGERIGTATLSRWSSSLRAIVVVVLTSASGHYHVTPAATQWPLMVAEQGVEALYLTNLDPKDVNLGRAAARVA